MQKSAWRDIGCGVDQVLSLLVGGDEVVDVKTKLLLLNDTFALVFMRTL